ncbi:outer membrane protein assembly factor BamE [Aquiflexum gelatinilyticum]|uniref:Outer membrane protein assembly factor BamE n=1 Tax=Aquiflexum gelatinilyticum TaxID=2961943 RepID=A0A9X2P426_9BACT|nr:outer membrane protein assembly factor BamE [Aquiflexum gelatinilyticum]MCR9015909.1 outer membrane protein assembly factor BamE [Aquiflexum gelatinilyticum]
MKKLFKAILSAGFLVLAISLYFIKWSPGAIKGNENAEKIMLIKNGMSMPEVFEIIGLPIEKMGNTYGDSVYYYQTPFAAASNISVSFDHSGRVVHIQPLE